jgi:hypothetical protein
VKLDTVEIPRTAIAIKKGRKMEIKSIRPKIWRLHTTPKNSRRLNEENEIFYSGAGSPISFVGRCKSSPETSVARKNWCGEKIETAGREKRCLRVCGGVGSVERLRFERNKQEFQGLRYDNDASTAAAASG